MAGVVAGCGGIWQGWGYVVGGQAYGMDGDIVRGRYIYGRVWGYVAGCGHMWQGVGQGVGECGRGMWYGVRPMA